MNIIKPIIKDNNNINPLILSQTPKSGINHKRIKNNIKILNGNSLKNSSSKFLINTCENSNINISHNNDNTSPKLNINNYKENNKKGISLKKRNFSMDKNRRIKTNEKFSKKIRKEIKKEISNNSFLTKKNLKKIIFIQRWWRSLSCIILIQTFFRGFIYRKYNLDDIIRQLKKKEDMNKKKFMN